MNIRIALSVLIAIILLVPFMALAQYYFGDGQYGSLAITPSGPPNIVFPVQGGASFTDDFGDPRGSGVHEGNDLKAPKMTPVVAARGGRIVFAPTTEPSYGYMLSVAGDDGYKYNYIHINNDTPGTDDDSCGPQYAYAAGIKEGVRVTQGQHIAWVGDSGNAEATVSHLHFEIRLPDGTAMNPYPYLNIALKIYTYDVAAAKAASPTINSDKGLIITPSTILYCVAGSLIRIPSISSIYYCGSDGRRYVFPNERTYATWYDDFSSVQMITPEDMSKISLGGNVTYRPGVKLVKIQTDPKVYAVERNGTLRWIMAPAIAAKYYGTSWAKNLEDVPDVFFTNYKIGNPVTE